MLSAQHIEIYLRCRKIAFDKKQKFRSFKVGQRVLLRNDRHKDFPEKFDALW